MQNGRSSPHFLLRRGCYCQSSSCLRAPTPQNLTATLRLHASSETVNPLTPDSARLIGPFHRLCFRFPGLRFISWIFCWAPNPIYITEVTNRIGHSSRRTQRRQTAQVSDSGPFPPIFNTCRDSTPSSRASLLHPTEISALAANTRGKLPDRDNP